MGPGNNVNNLPDDQRCLCMNDGNSSLLLSEQFAYAGGMSTGFQKKKKCTTEHRLKVKGQLPSFTEGKRENSLFRSGGWGHSGAVMLQEGQDSCIGGSRLPNILSLSERKLQDPNQQTGSSNNVRVIN